MNRGVVPFACHAHAPQHSPNPEYQPPRHTRTHTHPKDPWTHADNKTSYHKSRDSTITPHGPHGPNSPQHQPTHTQQHHSTHPPAHNAQPTTPTTAPDASTTRTTGKAWLMAAPPSSSALTTAPCPFALAMYRGVQPSACHAHAPQHSPNTTMPRMPCPQSHNHAHISPQASCDHTPSTVHLATKSPATQSHLTLHHISQHTHSATTPQHTSRSQRHPAYHTHHYTQYTPDRRTLAWLMAALPSSSALTTAQRPV